MLRAFEKEMGVEVIRPDIAGLMGAFGAALVGKSKAAPGTASHLLTAEALQNFKHEVRSVVCKGCGNHCQLTVNQFDGGRRFISGNRCETPIVGKKTGEKLNMFAYKVRLLNAYKPVPGPAASWVSPWG